MGRLPPDGHTEVLVCTPSSARSSCQTRSASGPESAASNQAATAFPPLRGTKRGEGRLQVHVHGHPSASRRFYPAEPLSAPRSGIGRFFSTHTPEYVGGPLGWNVCRPRHDAGDRHCAAAHRNFTRVVTGGRGPSSGTCRRWSGLGRWGARLPLCQEVVRTGARPSSRFVIIIVEAAEPHSPVCLLRPGCAPVPGQGQILPVAAHRLNEPLRRPAEQSACRGRPGLDTAPPRAARARVPRTLVPLRRRCIPPRSPKLGAEHPQR